MNTYDHKSLAQKILKVAGRGVLFATVSVVAPIFPYAVLRVYLKRRFKQDYKLSQIKGSVNYLKRKKFIAYKNKRFILTSSGRKYLNHKALDDIQIKKTDWDQKWRIVTFDIPQDKTAIRHLFRHHLKRIGFHHFQRSVFIIPYPCEKQLKAFMECLAIEDYVHVLVCERFRNDNRLVKKFKINKIK